MRILAQVQVDLIGAVGGQDFDGTGIEVLADFDGHADPLFSGFTKKKNDTRVWAGSRGNAGPGATFQFTLPTHQETES